MSDEHYWTHRWILIHLATLGIWCLILSLTLVAILSGWVDVS